MSRSLQDMVIAITGASGGIGSATAIACARAGMNVAISARRTDRLERVADEIRRLGRHAMVMRCDVGSDSDVMEFVARANRELGRLDAVFANAGYGFEAAAADMTATELRDIFEVNFFGTMRVIWAAVPLFRTQRSGHILITSSAVGRFTLPFYSAYTATKAAQVQVGRAMRAELAPEGIEVSTVHPITTQTDFFEVSAMKSGRRQIPLEQQIPRFFIQPPERVAEAIVRCLRSPRGEVWTCRSARLLAALLTACPSVADLVMRREAAKRRRWLAEYALPDHAE